MLLIVFSRCSQNKPKIIKAQLSLEAVHDKLQQFRNNVAFHARGKVAAQITARMNLRDQDTYLDLVFAIHNFQNLMNTLTAEELTAIPELPQVLEQLHVGRHPAFAPRSK